MYCLIYQHVITQTILSAKLLIPDHNSLCMETLGKSKQHLVGQAQRTLQTLIVQRAAGSTLWCISLKKINWILIEFALLKLFARQKIKLNGMVGQLMSLLIKWKVRRSYQNLANVCNLTLQVLILVNIQKPNLVTTMPAVSKYLLELDHLQVKWWQKARHMFIQVLWLLMIWIHFQYSEDTIQYCS